MFFQEKFKVVAMRAAITFGAGIILSIILGIVVDPHYLGVIIGLAISSLVFLIGSLILKQSGTGALQFALSAIRFMFTTMVASSFGLGGIGIALGVFAAVLSALIAVILFAYAIVGVIIDLIFTLIMNFVEKGKGGIDEALAEKLNYIPAILTAIVFIVPVVMFIVALA